MSTKRTNPLRRTAPRFRRPVTALAVLALSAALGLAGPQAAQAQPQTFSAAELAAAGDAVLAADIAGTAWGVNPATGTVLVTVDKRVSATEVAELRRSAGAQADALTFERTAGTLQPHLQGGEPVWSNAGRCTAGFNVRAGTADYFVTAGHCTQGVSTWYTNASRTTTIGPTAATSFPGNDYGIVRYTNPAVPRPGTVNCGGTIIDITGPANPTVGQRIWLASSTTGCHSGAVTGLNATVNYGAGGIVSGLIQTTLCSEPGDSGSPVFTRTGDGTTGLAVGVLSGGSGNCASGATSFVQPINEVLAAYGAVLT
ncbi:S1 family peptidase [Streptomyces sp. NBC_01498]|uniref:S1 family peptidase n=1 Tax=Streptomyces sp. NBC_01498 TaxID=2975870 RepID=UPI002E7ADAC2|nr:S1 family peptidase [Streptomyces sp. NBC_01498]WTL23465.1 S1 family peptidase [Streptomyces sp. NBC_01498]